MFVGRDSLFVVRCSLFVGRGNLFGVMPYITNNDHPTTNQSH